MSELYALLLWLLCVGISAIAIGYYIKYYGLSLPKMNEGFVVITCPANSTKYINKHGDTNCCNGDIVNDECNGNNLCSLSPSNTLGIPNCSDYINDLANDAATENCFADMPYFFAASDGSLKGCSASITIANGTAPSDPGKLQCILYPTAALDEVKLDSCYNYKKNKAALSGANCPVATSAATGAATGGATGAATGGATGAATSMANGVANGAANGVSSVAQGASSAAHSVSSAMGSFFGSSSSSTATPAATSTATPVATPAAPANPTGYVIYGEGISGNLPVTKIIEFSERGPDDPLKVFLLQDGSLIRAVVTDLGYTKRLNSLYFTANLSDINDFAAFNGTAGRVGVTFTKYNIKKADGTGILTAS